MFAHTNTSNGGQAVDPTYNPLAETSDESFLAQMRGLFTDERLSAQQWKAYCDRMLYAAQKGVWVQKGAWVGTTKALICIHNHVYICIIDYIPTHIYTHVHTHAYVRTSMYSRTNKLMCSTHPSTHIYTHISINTLKPYQYTCITYLFAHMTNIRT
jgi:hypothetical protein